MKQKLVELEKDTDKSTIIQISNSLLLVNRTNKQKICSIIEDFKNTTKLPWHLLKIPLNTSRIPPPFFPPRAHEALTKIEYIFWDKNKSQKLFKN